LPSFEYINFHCGYHLNY